jgi:arylsulfatase A-like enzyme/Flp pilus assembly protein TadD
MRKRPFSRGVRIRTTLVLALLPWTMSACAGSPGTEIHKLGDQRPRSLILVTIDTLRADRVGVLAGGSATGDVTPALDALGRSGTVFLDATAHAPLTLPSHASILTGRYPLAHGVHDNGGFRLTADVATMATALHDAGFQTAAFVSSFVLRASAGLSRGFDRYDDRFEGAGRAHQTASELERRGPETAREAARWLATAPPRFFLWVHFYDPHAPYDPPPAFAARFPGRPYDGEVATADFALSVLVNALSPDRRAGTLIVVTGDHGESLGEHGESEHGVLLYDATLHVPLVMTGPGIAAGARIARQVRHVDLVPTLAQLLSVKPPSTLDGISLVPVLASSATSAGAGEPPASYAESRFGELHFGWSPLRSVRDGTWKYIESPAPRLFQLSADPAELDNRRDARPDTAAGMARVLAVMSARGDSATGATPAANADASERLRTLGYVSGRVTIGSATSGRSGGEDPNQEIARYEAYVKAFNEGLANLEQGQLRAAEASFRRLARDYPLAFEAHQYLGRALAARRAFVDAAAEYDVAIRLSRQEPALYFDAARALADAAQFDRAFALTAEGRKLEPSSYSGALTEGLVARAAGQTDRAERALHEAVTLNPTLSVAHLELGRIAEARRDLDGARREYQHALDGDETLTAAREGLDRLRP